MKKVTLFLLVMGIPSVSIMAQSTLLKNDSAIRMSIAPMLEISRLADQPGISGGANISFAIKNLYAGVYYLDHNGYKSEPGDYDLRFRHAGLLIGYFINPEKLIHFQANVKAGIGSLDQDYRMSGNGINRYSTDLLILNPSMGAEINLTSFIKLGVNAGYRFTDALDVMSGELYLDNQDYHGMTMEATLRIGNF